MDSTSVNFLAGLGAGLANVLCLSPIDTVRTRIVMNGTSFPHCVSRIVRNEGVRGFYRAGCLSCLAFPLNWSIYFAVYSRLNNVRDARVLNSMIAGISAITVTNPIWLLRTRIQLQTENSGKYKGLVQGSNLIFKEEGMTPFFRGLVTSLFGIAHVSVQIPLYEYFKHQLGTDQPTSLQIFWCSTASKVVASLMTYPQEVLRTCIFANGKSVSATTKTLYTEGGVFRFYKGFAPNLVKIIPSSFITLCTYEAITAAFCK